jgi:hypothetical protein
MPAVLRVGRLRVVFYPNDHPPAHVHVLCLGWVAVIICSGRRFAKLSTATNASCAGRCG